MRKFMSAERSITRLVIAVAFAIVMGLSASQAGAASYNLQDLITNGTVVTVGDKEFSSFSATFTPNNCGSPNSCSPSGAAGITVNTISIDAFHHGLEFASGFQVVGGNAHNTRSFGVSVNGSEPAAATTTVSSIRTPPMPGR